jgi:hypothetical protein
MKTSLKYSTKTKIVFLCVALFAGAAAFSQQLGKTTIGVRAGVNFQNLNGKDENDDKLSNDLKVGFNVGVNAEVPITQDFYVQPGLLYSTKGAREKDVNGDEDAKLNITYLEIPVNLLYKPALGEGHLLMGFGPYVAFGVGGKFKVGDFDTDVKFDNDVSLAELGSGVHFRRLDAGANLLFGYELSNNLSAQINAQLGLVNIQPDVEGNKVGTTKNTGFGISLGYRF